MNHVRRKEKKRNVIDSSSSVRSSQEHGLNRPNVLTWLTAICLRHHDVNSKTDSEPLISNRNLGYTHKRDGYKTLQNYQFYAFNIVRFF